MRTRQQPTTDPADIGRLIAQSGEFSMRTFPGVAGLARSFAGAFSARMEAAETPVPSTPGRIAGFGARSIRESEFGRYIAYQFTLEGAGEPAALFVELPIFYGWYELVAGGSANEEISIPRRAPSTLEMETGMSFARILADALIAVFEGQSAFGPVSITPAPIGKLLEKLGEGDCFQIALNHAGSSVPGEIIVALPVKIVEHLRVRSEKPAETPKPVRPVPPTREDHQWSQKFRKSVAATHLRLDVVVGLSEMTLAQIAALRPGSQIRLSEGPGDAMIESNGKPVFKAQLGQAGGRYMLRYTGDATERTEGNADALG